MWVEIYASALGRTNLALWAPAPNPVWSPHHRIRVVGGVPAGTQWAVSVYDIEGRRIGCLGHGISDGTPILVQWEGTDRAGVANQGVFFLRLETDAGSVCRKVVVVR